MTEGWGMYVVPGQWSWDPCDNPQSNSEEYEAYPYFQLHIHQQKKISMTYHSDKTKNKTNKKKSQ